VRSTNSPIAAIIVRKASHLAITSGVEVAPTAMCGITNCGAGPALGPIANVNAPCTGCPSTEMARQ